MEQTKPTKIQSLQAKSKLGKFISAVSSKNYAEANKYLKDAVEDKLLTKINNATEKPLF